MESKEASQAKALREAFNKVDTNSNGYLDHKEIAEVLKEVGVEASPEELEKFFTEVDTDHDNQISFEELSVWYRSGRGGKVGQVQSKFLSALKQYKRESSKKDKEALDEKKHIDSYHVGLSLGTLQEGKTKVEIGVQFGNEAAERFTELSNGLDIQQPASLILQFSSENPSEAKEPLLKFFTEALEVISALGVVPPEVPLDQIKFTASHDDKHVRIGIQAEHEVLNSVSQQVDFFSNAFLEGNLTGSLDLQLHLNTSVGDLVEGQDLTIVDQILKGGAFNFDFRLPRIVADLARNFLTQNVSSLSPQAEVALEKLGPLLLLKKANIQLDFENGDAWSKALSQIPPIKFGDLLPQLQGLNLPELAAISFPPLADFINVAETNLNADLKIYVRGPQTLAHVHLKSEGLGKLWSTLKSN